MRICSSKNKNYCECLKVLFSDSLLLYVLFNQNKKKTQQKTK